MLEFLNRCGVDTHYLEPGGGKKMVCLNRDSGAYDLRFVPYDGLPRGNEDVGYIFAYSITKVDVTGEYKDAGEVSGKAELMKWELLDAVTGEVLESGEFGGEAPFILFPDERSGFDNEISYAEIQDMIEKLWRDSGRKWY